MGLTVVEILERSSQGMTEPYICRCDDGQIYFVKGHSATRPGLTTEWLCARLGEAFGLPIAPHAIVTVPEELIEADLKGWLRGLGAGEVFASCRISAVDLTRAHLDLVSDNMRQDVIAFDWWVRNGDRNLTDLGGNPNLLWNPADGGSLVVIDHNLAFDSAFSEETFVNTHVFSADIPAMFSNVSIRNAYAARFAKVLGLWDEICDTLPTSWSYIDPEQTIPVEFLIADVKSMLDRALIDTFWNLPP
ncbi:HipA-like kinase domain-containing protein [Gammaproteobacteria bacterium]